MSFAEIVGGKKTRVPVLSCGVVCVILRLAVSVEHRLVTDRQTDRRLRLIPRKVLSSVQIAYCIDIAQTVRVIAGPQSDGSVHFRSVIFTARRYASAVLGVVILSASVRPSVRLSHACFVTNPKNLLAIFLYHMKGQYF